MRFGAVPSSLTPGALQSIRVNAANNAWEAYTPITGLAIGDTVTSGTAKSVLYLGASNVLAQDNSNFAYDYTNQRLGLGTNAPTERLTVNKSGNVTTINNALGLRNTTPTNGGNGNEFSPALEFESHGRLESAAADKKGLLQLFLKTPYQASGSVIYSHAVFRMDRGSIGSYNNLFEMISPAPQETTVSNAFRFYRLDGSGGLDLVVDSNNTASFYAMGTTNYVPFLGYSFGGHSNYQAFDCSVYYSPKVRANFNGTIEFKAGRINPDDGTGASGSEKVVFSLPVDFGDGKHIAFGATTGTKIGTGSTQKLAFYGQTPIAQRPDITPLDDSTGGSASIMSLIATGDSDVNDNFARIAAVLAEHRQFLTDIGLTG